MIAVLGDLQLTDRELEDRMRRESPFVQAQLSDPQRKRDFVERQIRMEALAIEGWRRGLASDPDVEAEFRQAVVKRLMRDELARIAAGLKVTEEELRQAYADRQDEFVRPAMVRFSSTVIEVGNDGERRRAQQRLRAIERKAAAPKDADTHTQVDSDEFLSQEEVRAKYGDEAASRLFEASKVGDIIFASSPNAVMRLEKTGFRRAVERAFDSVKSQLGAQILAEKKTRAFNEYVGGLTKSLGLVVDAKKLEALVSPTPVPVPVPVPVRTESTQ
ncbi:MAG: peptidyl-prolyl cis-trans isomerase [Deltaproteobacteria bacterium]|nr:peptidyl-prolyl cis-trans isomerase [Deltaproteobacteria bacterium]